MYFLYVAPYDRLILLSLVKVDKQELSQIVARAFNLCVARRPEAKGAPVLASIAGAAGKII